MRTARGGQRRRPQAEPDATEQDLGPAADPESVGRTILLNKLTGRARSRHELAEALSAKDVPDEIAARLLDRFEDVGLVNDQAFADAWVESRHTSRGLSRRALSVELRRKGVADDVIADSVSAIDQEQERGAAEALIARKIGSTRRFDRQARFRRLTGLLARKGYPPAMCASVVREAIADDERGAGGDGSSELDDVVIEDFGLD